MGNETSRKKKTSGSLIDKEIAVLKANTKLSEKEIRKLYDEFKREGESGTDKMDKNQFLKYYKKIMGSEDENGVLADNTFAVFDTNHDGSIDFSEFVLATAIGNKNDMDSQFDLAFALMDTSGDKHISYEEMVNFLGKMFQLSGQSNAATIDPEMVASDVYKMFGLDKGQNLSKKQFIDGCKSNDKLAELFEE